MKNRNPIAVALLGFIPFYSLYWYITTGREMRKAGADVPTAWLLIVPFANIWWLYKYGMAVEQVTGAKISAILAFLAVWFLGSIGQAIVQDSFNKVDALPIVGGSQPYAPQPPAAPTDYNAPSAMPITQDVTPPSVPTPTFEAAPAPEAASVAPEPTAPEAYTPPAADVQQPPSDPTNA